MKLSPGTKLQRYEIQSLIGQGGMGEVYLASDSELGRQVAVKVLNQSDDFEKLRRFRQEAKTISTLSHPNILTLYEFGQHEDFHFIVSEYIKGETLREVLRRNELTLDEILDIAVQIGNALAAAHESGIIHRDIKPENIMILPDGYVKVLDFGLAKLTNLEKMLQSNPDAPTASVIHTQSGLIMGTVNYMSPEQLRGQETDGRTDIWALGVVLYEMLTGRQPFTGASVSDTIAAILNQPPPAVAPALPGIPAEFETVIFKSLEKKKDDRFQTAKEFVRALKNLKNYFLSQNALSLNELSRQFTDPQKPSPADKNESIRFKNFSQLVTVKPTGNLTALLLLTGIALGIAVTAFYILRPGEQDTSDKIKITRLMTNGNTTNAAISPDGRIIAYVLTDNGMHSLWVRQTEETAGNEIIPPAPSSFSNLTFSPDGDWIYFTKFEDSSSGTLYRTPFLRGSRQEVVRDIDSPICFSPDGTEFAFIRSKPDEGVDRLLISSIDGTNLRVLTEKTRPEFFIRYVRESLAWSPDGKAIAYPLGRISDEGDSMGLVEINLATKQETPLTDKRWARVGRVLWTKDINKLLITAADFGSDLYQIVKVNRADKKTQNLTSELSDYFNISLSRASNRLLATTIDKNSSLSTAASSQINRLKQITGVGYDGIGGAVWTSDGRIVFVSMESGNADIWIMNADGTNRRQLTFDKSVDDSPVVSRDNRHIIFVSSRTGSPHIWRINFDGGDAQQLTSKGDASFPQIAPGGEFVIFSARADGRPRLWKVPTEGGEAAQLTKKSSHWSAISPDGKMIACLGRGDNHTDPMTLDVISAEDGKLLKTFKFSGDASPTLSPTIRWLPDAQAIAYVATKNGVSNILSQPLAGGEPKKLTDFSTDRIFTFDFSSDGKQVLFVRGVLRNYLMLGENF